MLIELSEVGKHTLKLEREVLLFIDTCISVIQLDLRAVTGVMGRDVLRNRTTPV